MNLPGVCPISRLLFGGILLLLGLCDAHSQTLGSATPLGLRGASARANSLGGGMVGLADDSSALFFNSAGLAGTKGFQLSLHHNNYLAGTFEETLLAGFTAGPWGGFAGALQYVNWGNIDRRDAFGVAQGNSTDNDVALSVGWGKEWTPHLSFGVALHGYQQKISENSYLSFSGDLGLLWRPEEALRLGLAYSGLGTPISGRALASDLKAGLSRQFDLEGGTRLTALLAGSYGSNGVSRLQAGLEGAIAQNYFLRVGYQLPLTGNQADGFNNLTTGAGLRFAGLDLDYAFLPYGDLGASHQISLSYDFPNPAPAKAVIGAALPTPAPTPARSSLEVHFELPTDTTSSPDPTAMKELEKYKKTMEKDPQDSQAWRNLGVVYFRAGRTAEALQCFEQALRLKPGDKELDLWIQKYKDQK